MALRYEIKDNSNKSRDGILYGGSIELGGDDRNYKSIARLPNDVEEDPENSSSYIAVGGSSFETNVATISCWINPEGVSGASSGVVLHTAEDGKMYGLVLRANDVELNVGYVWGTTLVEQDIDFGITLPRAQWSHVLLVIYESGVSRLFVNNIYVATHDTGYIRKKVVLDNIEIGRFSGLIDNVSFYSDTLDYGNVPLNTSATHEVLYVYSLNRTEYEPKPVNSSPTKSQMVNNYTQSTNGIRFYYGQSSEYVDAHDKYINNTIRGMNNTGGYLEDVLSRQSSEELDEQKFTTVGGPNAGIRTFADGNFRTIPGEIVEL